MNRFIALKMKFSFHRYEYSVAV